MCTSAMVKLKFFNDLEIRIKFYELLIPMPKFSKENICMGSLLHIWITLKQKRTKRNKTVSNQNELLTFLGLDHPVLKIVVPHYKYYAAHYETQCIFTSNKKHTGPSIGSPNMSKRYKRAEPHPHLWPCLNLCKVLHTETEAILLGCSTITGRGVKALKQHITRL
jgi:hypothetical protein